MVRVDFTEYRSYSTSPVWWRNFIDTILRDGKLRSTDERNDVLDDALAKYHCTLYDEESGPEEIDYIEFETEDDFNAFKLVWRLHGS